MSYANAWVLAIAGLIFQAPCLGQSLVTVGNAPGEVATVIGPSKFAVDLGKCRFSVDLLPSQRMTFNDPDLVVYYSGSKEGGEAHLRQAETNFGASWSFEKKGSRQEKWLGMMCESAENFSAQTLGRKTIEGAEVSSALSDVRESNDLRCPADLKDGKWIPRPILKKGESYVFAEISGAGWVGFLIGYKASKSRKELSSLRFCALSGDNVLMGAAENSEQPLAIPVGAMGEIIKSLSTIRFSD
ncbi:hypothetical protein A9Y76_23090 [Ralstonia insidiosa]|uniref:Uncharacterized protein n=2 Tax=Ralstonia insidiosa TaxID=190721 RepID=A0A192A556_9RALS|nr:hypothetical protein A9Y76_23090 [Ralstonia insidiosa]